MLSEMEIEAAVGRIGDGLRKYLWLQAEVGRRDVSNDAVFQRRFNGFYRVRRNADWRKRYFRLMEESKAGGAHFTHVLRTLHAATGRYEASFAILLGPSCEVLDYVVFVVTHPVTSLSLPIAVCRVISTSNPHAQVERCLARLAVVAIAA